MSYTWKDNVGVPNTPCNPQELADALMHLKYDCLDTWQPNTTTVVGMSVIPTIPDRFIYECISSGTTGTSEPNWTPLAIGESVIDGSVTWLCTTKTGGTGGGGGGTGTVSTSLVRQLAKPATNFGMRRYNHFVVPPQSGTTGASTVPLCRINIHGFGFQGSGSKTYSKAKIMAGCLDRGITMELTMHRSLNSWRVDIQSYMGGSSAAESYYVVSRGSQFKQNANGWLLAAGQTENNSAITEEHSHYIGAAGAEWAYPPVFWPSQSTWDITHYHPLSVPYKINKTIGGVLKNSAEDLGTAPEYLHIAVYTDAGVLMSNPYTVYSTDWIELRVLNLPQLTGIRPLVSSAFEFVDCNHTIWFYDSERAMWETPPVVGIIGDSAVEGTDLQDLVFFNYSASPYGDVYRHAWSEKRGYWNYGWDGSMMIETLTRISATTSSIQFNHKTTGWSGDKGFTHVIIGVGANEAVETVLRRRGVTLRYALASWDGDYMKDLDNIVKEIQKVTSRSVTPVLLLFANVWDAQAIINTGGNYPVVSLSDGSAAGTMTLADWQNVITEFTTITNDMFDYAVTNGLPVIDWFELSRWFRFDTSSGSFMCSAGHLNLNGQLNVANYVDVVRRV